MANRINNVDLAILEESLLFPGMAGRYFTIKEIPGTNLASNESLLAGFQDGYNKIMIELNTPGRDPLQLQHLVCDVNGTLAVDGRLLDGLARSLASLRDRLQVHLLTADTHGKQHIIDQQLNIQAIRIPPRNEAFQKAEYVRRSGPAQVAAIGQGANDAEMLKLAALGICVFSTEGVIRFDPDRRCIGIVALKDSFDGVTPGGYLAEGGYFEIPR